MRLNEISDRPGATQSKKRVGRGIGSGLGKTSGRGQKGQKSRSGVAVKGFEGGQMPLHRRLPKRGFTNIFAKDVNEVNLGTVQAAIDTKKLDPKNPITVQALQDAGLIKRARDGVRLLGDGELKTKATFEVTGASSGAVKAVEAAGGSVTITPMPQRTAKGDCEGKPKKERKAAARSPAKKAAAKKTASPKKDTSE
jgi:large subunit ribosomal protein L15